MKIIFALLILISPFAFAENYQFGNADVGYLNIKTDDAGPAYERYRMQITVTCKDQRKVKNLISPVAEEVIPEENVCILLRPKYEAKTTDVVITFGKSTRGPGEGKCKEGYTQTFNVKELCSAWRR